MKSETRMQLAEAFYEDMQELADILEGDLPWKSWITMHSGGIGV